MVVCFLSTRRQTAQVAAAANPKMRTDVAVSASSNPRFAIVASITAIRAIEPESVASARMASIVPDLTVCLLLEPNWVI